MAGSGLAEGINAIRQALADYVAMEPNIEVTTRRVVEAGHTALLVADWRFRGTARDGGVVSTSGTSIEVARRQPDGSWRYHIDLPLRARRVILQNASYRIYPARCSRCLSIPGTRPAALVRVTIRSAVWPSYCQ
jgi:hypothetical protein